MPFLGMPFLTRSFFELTSTPNSKATTSPTVVFFLCWFRNATKERSPLATFSTDSSTSFSSLGSAGSKSPGFAGCSGFGVFGIPPFFLRSSKDPGWWRPVFSSKKAHPTNLFLWCRLDMIGCHLPGSCKKRPILIMIGLNAIQTRWPFLSGA